MSVHRTWSKTRIAIGAAMVIYAFAAFMAMTTQKPVVKTRTVTIVRTVTTPKVHHGCAPQPYNPSAPCFTYSPLIGK